MKFLRQFFLTRKEAFRFAFSGCWYMIKTQKNTWIHAIATICVFAVAAWLQLQRIEWAILILTIGIVWLAEAVNTAVETTIDLCSPQKHPLAKIAKDTAAAAVLMAAITSVVIGLLILGPPLWAKIISWIPVS